MGEPKHDGLTIPGRVVLAHERPFVIGSVTVEPSTRQLNSDGKHETLEPLVMQALVALARAGGNIVTRDELIERCWDGRIVTDDAINRVLSRIRQVASGIGGGSFKDEAERLLDACGLSLNPQLRPIVHLLMVTGARVSELLQARWEHVDLERKTWHIPMSKNGKGRHVPLAAVAVEVIQALPRYWNSPYLVCNPETGRPFVSIKHAWQTARRKAGLADLRIHDLRHHCGGALVNSGASLYTVAKVLGHSDLKSSERYSYLLKTRSWPRSRQGRPRRAGPRSGPEPT